MTRKSTRPVSRAPRKDHAARRVEPKQHDTYKARSKPAGVSVCPGCGVVYQAGKWSWGEAEAGAHEDTCPACRRIHDGYPVGTIELFGEGFEPFKDEVAKLIRNVEEREKAEHPLERLMCLEHRGGGLHVETTGMHLARSVASAVKRRFHGHIQITYPEGENRVRVTWQD